jgi:hypothetical protein
LASSAIGMATSPPRGDRGEVDLEAAGPARVLDRTGPSVSPATNELRRSGGRSGRRTSAMLQPSHRPMITGTYVHGSSRNPTGVGARSA